MKITEKHEDAGDDGRSWMRGALSRNVPYMQNRNYIYARARRSDAGRLEHIRAGSVHAIITDPPYGFNVARPVLSLVGLWKSMVSEFCRILNPAGGHVVICTAASAKTGKHLSSACGPGFVRALLIREAAKCGRVVERAEMITAKEMEGERYYYRSRRGVDRAVMHYVLRERGA